LKGLRQHCREAGGARSRNRTGTPLLARDFKSLVSTCSTIRAVWRRGSESNRRPRLCRPLHNHSATPPGVLVKPTLYVGRDVVCVQLKGESMMLSPMIWSGKRDSNSRPIPWQGIALPTELFPRQRDAHCNDGGLFVKHKCAFALTGLGRGAMLKSLFVFLSSAYVRQYQIS
jgi:hypothetical protein